MKQLRAEGILKLVKEQRDDAVHLIRLSREDPALQREFRLTLDSLEKAEEKLESSLIKRERIDA